eukprot:m.191104 g.191104  ORF g.191104 m.191104 type:complete len:71 (-) comp24909_c0_seq2:1718-1930(-)
MSSATLGLATHLARSVRLVRHQSTRAAGMPACPHSKVAKQLRQAMWDSPLSKKSRISELVKPIKKAGKAC